VPLWAVDEIPLDGAAIADVSVGEEEAVAEDTVKTASLLADVPIILEGRQNQSYYPRFDWRKQATSRLFKRAEEATNALKKRWPEGVDVWGSPQFQQLLTRYRPPFEPLQHGQPFYEEVEHYKQQYVE
jgi:hypothetical protein